MKAIQTANNGGNSRFSLKNNHYIKLLSNINRTGLFSAFTFLLLALTCLFPISKGEQSTEAVTGHAQSSSLTLSVAGDTASVELDMNSTEGTFASSSAANSASFSVVTNNFSGYTLSISGSDNDGKLYDTTKQYFLEPLTSAVSEADFSSTSSLNGKWGYKPSKFNSAVNSNYLPAPTTTASTLDKTSVANATANDYTISLGLRADYGTAANTYTNAFVITAVPNPIAYVITYNANTTDTVSNMPAAQNSTTSATSITLSDKTPAREGYDFKGWCTVAPTEAAPDTCTGLTFQPGAVYGIDQTVENITTLYAMWDILVSGYIQDYTYSQCSTDAVNRPVRLLDKRDNKTYTVRYINGLCTMTQNLAVDKGQAMTPEDTNINSNYTMTSADLEAGDNSYTVAEIHEGDATNGNWYNYCAATAGEICQDSTTIEATQDICPKGWRLPTGQNGGEQTLLTNGKWQTYDTTYQALFNPVASGFYNNGALGTSGSEGRWWLSTALSSTDRYVLDYTAGWGLYSGDGFRRSFGLSIRCVKAKPGVTISFNTNGGTGTMDMQKIDAGQSANLTANTFTRTDYIFTGWNTEPDGSGTSYADQASYSAASEDNKIVVLYAQWRDPNLLDNETNMQDLTTEHCTGSDNGSTAIVTDSRDSKTYKIAKINGVCTMVDNLDFQISTGMTLSPDTTNVTASRTLGTVGSLTSGNSYDEMRTARNSSVTGAGLHYNYAAATAGTITGSSNSTEATQGICPKGWRLPTNSEQSKMTSYQTEFDPVAAGLYSGGSLSSSSSYGLWWSSTAGNATTRYILSYNTNNGLRSGSYGTRNYGRSVRCVLK
ncbi:InlB B-repeat-containing protein [Congzhengia minquanensis]|uniref:InlB B-repeat-containing protein n=1 Tax=Congzhengia minquanensis TaxID=2763657 RepID=A0A926HYR7_9FIRM|nr:FISUMP domain-containing protein [Congzhengia minquanensis]MBC8540081.1 InlB B-repeat-containing protein [Congzhengia minquanensis]